MTPYVSTEVEFIGGPYDGRFERFWDLLPSYWVYVPPDFSKLGVSFVEENKLPDVDPAFRRERYELRRIFLPPPRGILLYVYVHQTCMMMDAGQIDEHRKRSQFLRAVVDLGRTYGYMLTSPGEENLVMTFNEDAAAEFVRRTCR